MKIFDFGDGITATVEYDSDVGAPEVVFHGLCRDLFFYANDSEMYDMEAEIYDVWALIRYQAANKLYDFKRDCKIAGISFLGNEEYCDDVDTD